MAMERTVCSSNQPTTGNAVKPRPLLVTSVQQRQISSSDTTHISQSALHKRNMPQQIKHERRLKPGGREYEVPPAQTSTLPSYALDAGRHGAK